MKFLKIFSVAFMMLSFALQTTTGQSTQRNPTLQSVQRSAELLAQTYQSQVGDIADYTTLSDVEFYSIGMHMDSTFEVVYKPETFRGRVMERLDLEISRASDFQSAGNDIELLLQGSGAATKYIKDEDNPTFIVQTTDFELIKTLRSHSKVDYIGFMGYSTSTNSRSSVERGQKPRGEAAGLIYDLLLGANSSSGTRNSTSNRAGCGNVPATELNFTVADDGSSIPWHYTEQGVTCSNSKSKGRGVKVALLDSGVSPNQPRLSTTGFKKSYAGRKLVKKGTFSKDWPFEFSDGVNDDCGHGTHMAGVIAAPVYDSAIRGIAYESDLLSIRCTDDVVINTTEELVGVYRALKKIRKGNESGYDNVSIISMSLGCPFIYNYNIAKELKKLKNNDVLVFAAAGTAPHWLPKDIVIFPADLSTTIAVTGVYKNFPTVKEPCDRCHWGKKIDFVVPMQFGNVGSNQDAEFDIVTHSLTMDSEELSNVGGSSIATASLAGIAAVIWGANENKNKDATAILNKMVEYSTYPYAKDAQFGHGVVDLKGLLDVNCEADPDPCAGVTCPDGEVCVDGECIRSGGGNGIECLNGQCPPDMYCVRGVCKPY